MAMLFFVKDGPRPDNFGPGHNIQLMKLYNQIPNLDPFYLGTEPPTFHEESPSMYPVWVVVEVSPSEVAGRKFNRPGFYVLRDLAPNQLNLSTIS